MLYPIDHDQSRRKEKVMKRLMKKLGADQAVRPIKVNSTGGALRDAPNATGEVWTIFWCAESRMWWGRV